MRFAIQNGIHIRDTEKEKVIASFYGADAKELAKVSCSSLNEKIKANPAKPTEEELEKKKVAEEKKIADEKKAAEKKAADKK